MAFPRLFQGQPNSTFTTFSLTKTRPLKAKSYEGSGPVTMGPIQFYGQGCKRRRTRPWLSLFCWLIKVCLCLLRCRCMYCFVLLLLVVSASAIEGWSGGKWPIMCWVGVKNSTHSLTHSLSKTAACSTLNHQDTHTVLDLLMYLGQSLMSATNSKAPREWTHRQAPPYGTGGNGWGPQATTALELDKSGSAFQGSNAPDCITMHLNFYLCCGGNVLASVRLFVCLVVHEYSCPLRFLTGGCKRRTKSEFSLFCSLQQFYFCFSFVFRMYVVFCFLVFG